MAGRSRRRARAMGGTAVNRGWPRCGTVRGMASCRACGLVCREEIPWEEDDEKIEKERKAKGIIVILFFLSSCEAILSNWIMKTVQLH